MLAGTRIPHHPHVRAHHAAIPPHSQAPSPSDAATPSGGLADDERDEAAEVEVLPESGLLVAFDSKRLWHEVMPTRRERTCLVGWFRSE